MKQFTPVLTTVLISESTLFGTARRKWEFIMLQNVYLNDRVHPAEINSSAITMGNMNATIYKTLVNKLGRNQEGISHEIVLRKCCHWIYLYGSNYGCIPHNSTTFRKDLVNSFPAHSKILSRGVFQENRPMSCSNGPTQVRDG